MHPSRKQARCLLTVGYLPLELETTINIFRVLYTVELTKMR